MAEYTGITNDHRHSLTSAAPNAPVTPSSLSVDTLWTAKGDLVKGTGNDAADILAIGTSGQVLRVASSTIAWTSIGTIFIAASDATDAEKATALASGGCVLTAVAADNKTAIETIDHTANGAEVRLLGNTIDVTSLAIHNSILTGTMPNTENGSYALSETQGTVINTTGGIVVTRGGALKGLMIHTESAFAGVALQVGGGTGDYMGFGTKILDDIYIYSDGHDSGTALKLFYVACCNLGTIAIRNFALGLHCYASADTHTNGNHIDFISIRGSNVPFKFENDSGNGVDGNTIASMQLQPIADQTTKIGQFVDAHYNTIERIFCWDWLPANGVLSFDVNSSYNTVKGVVPVDAETPKQLMVTDAGFGNRIDSTLMESSSRIITVKKIGGDYSTLAAALQIAATNATAASIYTIEVYGDIAETAKIEAFEYVNVIGHGAVITTSYATSPAISITEGNFLWKDLKFIATAIPQYGWLLVDDAGSGNVENCQFYCSQAAPNDVSIAQMKTTSATEYTNCKFTKAGAGTGAFTLWCHDTTTAIFNNCKFYGAGTNTSETFMAGDTANPVFNQCYFETPRGTGSVVFDFTTEPIRFIDCIACDIVTVHHDNAMCNAADLTDSGNIWLQPAGTKLISVVVKLDELFDDSGHALTDMRFTIGDGGDPDGILEATIDLESSTVGTASRTKGAYFDTTGEYYKESNAQYLGYATATGANLDTLDQGQITVYFTYKLVM